MSHRVRSLLIGIGAGGLLGAAFAWVASAMTDDDPETTAMTAVSKLGPMDYIALGIAILTLARQFGGMLKKA